MEYARLGSTGLTVSRICLGCLTFGSKQWREWMLEADAARPIIRHALDTGITHFDTADFYSLGVSETILGDALADFGVPRDKVVISSKVGLPVGADPNQRGLSRKHILHSIDSSLKRLRTDYIDLYQIHRFDPYTPVEETLEALDAIVRAGKALYIGASSMFTWQFAQLTSGASRRNLFRFASIQCHYNLIYREEERDMIPFCAAENVAFLPWSPLARGLLARGSDPDASLRAQGDNAAQRFYTHESDAPIITGIGRIANERGVPPAQVAIAWLLHQKQIPSAIIGATKLSHINDANSATSLKLTSEEIVQLTEPYKPHAIVGHHA